MSIISDLKEGLQGAETLRFIANTFTEINGLKAKNIRDSFEKNRQFFNEITDIYHTVKLSSAIYQRRSRFGKEYPSKDMEGRKIKKAAVAITSNLRFYGALNLKVMKKFCEDGESMDGHLFVVGQTGAEYLDYEAPKLEAERLTIKKDHFSKQEVEVLIDKTRGYEQVLLYYPKFLNMFSQEVGVIDITQTISEEEVERSFPRTTVEFIFEPELPKIVEFFENQIRSLLLKQALLETELSRTAARLLAMSRSKERADGFIKEKQIQLSKSVRSLKNAELLETFGRLRSWGGTT